MLMERQAAMKLARKLAQKIGAEPEKFGEIARKAAPAPEGQVCGLHYSPIPLGAAGKALNFMHYAVNGIRPYPEEGGDGTLRDAPCGEYECNGTYDAQKCGEGGEYYLSDCDEEAGYGACPACPTPWGCPSVFKCPSRFTCGSNTFSGCGGVFWQQDQGCPHGSTFNCPEFTCESLQNQPYGCRTFHCTSIYSCEGPKDCATVPAGYGCPAADKYNCPNDFECATFGGCDEDHFECGQQTPDGFSCTPQYS